MLSTLRGNRSSSKSLTHRRAQGYPLSHNKMGTNFPTTRSSTHCEAWGLTSKTKKRNLVKSILTSTLCGSNSDNSAQAPCSTGASPGPKQTTKPKPKKGKSQTKTIVSTDDDQKKFPDPPMEVSDDIVPSVNAVSSDDHEDSDHKDSNHEKGKERHSPLKKLMKLVSPIKGLHSLFSNKKISKRESCVDKASETSTGSNKDTRTSTDVLTVQELEEMISEEPEAPVKPDSAMTLINVMSSNASNSTDSTPSDKGIPFLPSDLERERNVDKLSGTKLSSSKQTRVSFGDVTVHELDDSATRGTTSAGAVTLHRPMTAKSGMAAKKSIAKGASSNDTLSAIAKLHKELEAVLAELASDDEDDTENTRKKSSVSPAGSQSSTSNKADAKLGAHKQLEASLPGLVTSTEADAPSIPTQAPQPIASSDEPDFKPKRAKCKTPLYRMKMLLDLKKVKEEEEAIPHIPSMKEWRKQEKKREKEEAKKAVKREKQLKKEHKLKAGMEKQPAIDSPEGGSQTILGAPKNLYSRHGSKSTTLSSSIVSSAKGEAAIPSRDDVASKPEPQEEAKQTVTSRPLGAHPRRKRSRTESVQQQDPQQYYSRKTYKKPDNELSSGQSEGKLGEVVLAWS